MTQWHEPMTAHLGQQIRKLREARGLSADKLAQAVDAIGVPYTRAQVTNLESGRRTTVTLGEVFAFARVLEVPPVVLILPIATDEDIEVLPGVHSGPWAVLRWFLGERPLAQRRTNGTYSLHSDHHSDLMWFDEQAQPIRLRRRHDELIADYWSWRAAAADPETGERAAERALSAARGVLAVRDEMRAAGVTVPDLREPLATVITELEAAREHDTDPTR